MISLLIYLLVLALIFGIAIYVLQLFPLPHPWRQIAIAILALIFVLLLISMLLGGIPLAPVRLQ